MAGLSTAVYVGACMLILLARLWSIVNKREVEEVLGVLGHPALLAAVGLLVWYVFAVHEAAVGACIGISCMIELWKRRRYI